MASAGAATHPGDLFFVIAATYFSASRRLIFRHPGDLFFVIPTTYFSVIPTAVEGSAFPFPISAFCFLVSSFLFPAFPISAF
jgi:hypothetical protein